MTEKLKPVGYLIEWPLIGGGFEWTFSRTRDAGDAIGGDCTPVFTDSDANALRKHIKELEAELSEGAKLNEKLAGILSKTAIAMLGSEPKLTMWGWDELPDRAAEQTALLKRAMEELDEFMSIKVDNALACCGQYGVHDKYCAAKALLTDIANHLEANNE